VSADTSRALLVDRPHRRLNALTGDWVFVSPHRTRRPWHGRIERGAATLPVPVYDPGCHLCPGNVRASGAVNPAYTRTYVWANDFPVFLPDDVRTEASVSPLMRARTQGGECRVICYSPRHDLTLAQMGTAEIRTVVDTWAMQVEELEAEWSWVQVFENKGEIMGCSNPHPHGQIWASDFIPNEVQQELEQQREWMKLGGESLLLEYAKQELAAAERVVLHNKDWVAVVPWWAAWPFETLLLPRRAVVRLPELCSAERESLAGILKELLTSYDRLFATSFPYSFGWHGAPPIPRDGAGGSQNSSRDYQLHAHFYPPLLRSATIRKFMVGYEMLAETQRDITPERAAEMLREKVSCGGAV
jgi:UDPglucose--hexose-1-phosphate uridylyltransferase